MTIFASESELLETLAEIEAALEQAAHSGSGSFREHYFKAGHLYGYYAIDGHESDEEERRLLAKHAERIARIEEALDSADGLCAEEDAQKEIYRKAGRYGADEAARRLRMALKIQK
jgi:hypothetical protein